MRSRSALPPMLCVLGLAGCATGTPNPPAVQPDPDLFANLARQARADSQYDVDGRMVRALLDALPFMNCLGGIGNHTPKLDLVVAVDADGRVSEAVVMPVDKVSRCLRNGAMGVQVGVPPMQPFHLRVQFGQSVDYGSVSAPAAMKAEEFPGAPPDCTEVTPPRLVYRVEPSPVRGGKPEPLTAKLAAAIDETGKVIDAKVVTATSAAWGEASVRAVRQWRYEPARCNGRAIRVEIKVSTSFTRY